MFHIWSCIEVDAVRYPIKHAAVSDSVVLGHAHPDTVASRVDHGLEVSGGVDPVVDSALGGVGCAGEHGEVVSETVGVAGIDRGLAFLLKAVISALPSVLATATQKVRTCSTATVSGSLEVTE